jgi:hypothetical protein
MFRCPECGVELKLALVSDKGSDTKGLGNADKVPPQPSGRITTFRINHVWYTLSDQEVLEAAANIEYPKTIRKYCVELADRNGMVQEFPTKQVVREALSGQGPGAFTDETNFNAIRARDILKNLGFDVKERY